MLRRTLLITTVLVAPAVTTAAPAPAAEPIVVTLLVPADLHMHAGDAVEYVQGSSKGRVVLAVKQTNRHDEPDVPEPQPAIWYVSPAVLEGQNPRAALVESVCPAAAKAGKKAVDGALADKQLVRVADVYEGGRFLAVQSGFAPDSPIGSVVGPAGEPLAEPLAAAIGGGYRAVAGNALTGVLSNAETDVLIYFGSGLGSTRVFHNGYFIVPEPVYVRSGVLVAPAGLKKQLGAKDYAVVVQGLELVVRSHRARTLENERRATKQYTSDESLAWAKHQKKLAKRAAATVATAAGDKAVAKACAK